MDTFIYTLGELPDIIRYIGQTSNFEVRLRDHYSLPTRKRSKSHLKKWIKSQLSKGQKLNPHIIDSCDDTEADFWERWWIQVAKGWGFDLVNGTNGGEKSKTYIPEVREKISKTLTGRKWSNETRLKLKQSREKSGTFGKWNLGKKRTEEYRVLKSKLATGRKHTEETKSKISAANIGRKNPPLTSKQKEKFLTSIKGLHSSEELRKKHSDGMFLKYATDSDFKNKVIGGLNRWLDSIDPDTGKTNRQLKSERLKEKWKNLGYKNKII